MLSRLKTWALGQFRPAKTHDSRSNLLKTLAQTTVFWTLFLAVFPLLIHTLENRLSLPVWPPASPSWWPWLLFGVAGSLGLSSGYTMATRGCGTPLPLDCPQRLVIHGPYRFVRNPMAVAGITQGIAVGFMLGSPLTILYSLSGAVVWHLTVRPIEEVDMLDRFGQDFVDYRDSVRCWWPRLTPYRPTGSPSS